MVGRVTSDTRRWRAAILGLLLVGQPWPLVVAASSGSTWEYYVQDELSKWGLEDFSVPALLGYAEEHGDERVRWLSATLAVEKGKKAAIPSLLRVLAQDRSEYVRGQVAELLLRLGETSGSDLVRAAMLRSGPLWRRIGKAGLLATAGDASGFEYVTQAAQEGEAWLRRLSAVPLAQFVAGDLGEVSSKALDQLDTLSRDADGAVRREALSAFFYLMRRGSPVAMFRRQIEAMASEDPDPALRKSAEADLADLDRIEQCAAQAGDAWCLAFQQDLW